MDNEYWTRLLWKLPYPLRRALRASADPRRYLDLRRLRSAEPARLIDPTLKPFIGRQCIFVHVPKAAGISMGYSLFGRHTGNHATIADYQLAFSELEFRRAFKFAFVRNPWDRLLSAYTFLKAGGRNESDQQWANQHLAPFDAFEEFVEGWVTPENVRKGVHFRPQHEFVTTPKGPELAVDFLGRFENIAEDYEALRGKLGFGELLRSENRTPGERLNYREHYTDEMRDVVARAYQDDIDIFGYHF